MFRVACCRALAVSAAMIVTLLPSCDRCTPTEVPAPEPAAALAPPPTTTTSPTTATSPTTVPAAAPAASADASPTSHVFKERWPNGKVKFEYQTARGPDGKVVKHGWTRAYYEDGPLEREGTYRYGERVGKWRYYRRNGTLDHEADFGDGRTSRA